MRSKEKASSDCATTFSTRLREMMENRNITQQKLADSVGVRRQTISQYMGGTTKPDTSALAAICKTLDVSANYLLGLSDVKMVDMPTNEKIGLSENAISVLQRLAQHKEYSDSDTTCENALFAINALLQYEDDGAGFFYALYLYLNSDDLFPEFERMLSSDPYFKLTISNRRAWDKFMLGHVDDQLAMLKENLKKQGELHGND